ncbi:MAG: transglutaminase family protein [Verrucomicrobiales bacterium]
MRLRTTHLTTYHYSSPVTNNVNDLRLRPRQSAYQEVEHCLVSVVPATRMSRYFDFNRNQVGHFEIAHPHQKLTIQSESTVRTRNKVDFAKLPYGTSHEKLPLCRHLEECYLFLHDSSFIERSPEIWRAALDIKDASDDVFQTAYAVMEHIHRHFAYKPGSTSVSTPAAVVIEKKEGVCQDFAHAMIAYCRAVGIPARYVSGYFYDATHDRHLRGAQASHAWVEIFLPEEGWIGLDPTNNKVVDETYVLLATGRDYGDVAPVMGTYFGDARCQLQVKVEVELLRS